MISFGELTWRNLLEGALESLARFVSADLTCLLNEAFGLFLVLGFDFGFGFGFRNYLRLMSRLISQPFALDTADCQIGPLYIVNAKGLTGIIPEIELGKVAI